jgi:hypothetical protein
MMSPLEALRFAIAAIAIRALGGATDLTREEIALALERAADDLRSERL